MIYYANNLIKFVSRDKFKEADDGFDGFMIRAEFLKSRTNKAGQSCNLIYNQNIGFDPILSLYQFADDHGRVDGRNPYKYFKGFKDTKFDSRKFKEEFLKNEDLQKCLIEVTKPDLNKLLSYGDEDINNVEDVDDIE